MNNEQLKNILEAAIMAAGQPITLERLANIFEEHERPDVALIRQLLVEVAALYADHSLQLKELASGYSFQVKAEYAPWLSRLWEERPARYSRALLETLALIAYRQPITRGEIEDIRGVSVSSQIMKTLQEREWIRIVGYRDLPGKPGLYATTRQFLDHFNLKSLDELPTLAELTQISETDVLTTNEAANTDIQLDIATELSNIEQHTMPQEADELLMT